MIDVTKIVPRQLDPDKEYIIRVRSINPLGTPSTWSEGLYIDTSRVTTAAGLFTQSNSEFSILNDDGEIVFGAFTTKRQRTNLIANPSFELDAIGWSALTSSVLSRLSVQSFYGNNSAVITPQTPVTSNAGIGITLSTSDYVPVGVNEFYTVSLYVYREYNPVEHGGDYEEHSYVRLTANLYDGSNNLKSQVTPSQSTRITNNEWTRVHIEDIRIPTGVSKLGLTLSIDAATTQPLVTGNERLFVDGALVEETSRLDSYFDGSTVDGSTTWSGTVHGSTSIFDNVSSSTVFIKGALNIGGLLQSTNYAYSAGVYSDTGTQIDLSTGTFTSPNFSIDSAGDVFIASGVTVEGYIQVGGAAGDINNNGTTISGDKITTGTLQGDRLSATTSIQVGDDNLGSYNYIVIEGGATPSQTAVRSADSGYGTGTGFYMDAAGRFSLGNTLTYDNGVLTIGGNSGGLDFIPTGGAAADINAGVTTISGGKITTGTLNAIAITTGTITADKIVLGGLDSQDLFGINIIGREQLLSDAIRSTNYDAPDMATPPGPGDEIFADLGAFFDLSTGKFTSKGLVVDNITGQVWINELVLDGVSIGGTFRLDMGSEATLASINHPFQIGADGTLNLVMDDNEIQARNNGFASELKLNEQGGLVSIGTGGLTTTGTLTGNRSTLSSLTNVTLSSTAHALTLGDASGLNIAFDHNSIQARDNATATPVGATLTLNEYGGNVTIGGEVFLQNSINLVNGHQIKMPGNSRIRYFDQTNELALTNLLGGTTLGLLIDGPHYGHVAIGLRANDDNDLFAITTPGIVADPNTALVDIVFSVNRRGDVRLDRDLFVGRDIDVTGSGTIDGDLTVIGSITGGSFIFDGNVFNVGGEFPPGADDNQDRGIQFRWHTGAASRLGFFGFDDSTQKFTFIPNATDTSGVYSGTKGEIDAFVDASNILNLSTSLDGTYVNVSGDTMIGHLITITPTSGGHAVNKTYADGLITTHVGLGDPHIQYLLSAGDTMTGDLLMSGNDIQMSDGIIALRALAGDERIYVDTVPVDDVTIIRASKDGALRTNFSVANANILTWNYNTGVRVYKDLLVDGNLTVSGTTSTVNSETLLVEDPIIRLGGVDPLTLNDGMDRGVEFRYYDTQSRLGFMGWDNSTSKFTLLTNVTNVSEVVSGTKATLDANVEFGDILNWTGTLDTRYVNVTGDTMTGNLALSSGYVSITAATSDSYPLRLLQGPTATAVHFSSNGDGFMGWVGFRGNGTRRFAFESQPSVSDGANFNLYEYDINGTNTRTIFTTSYEGGSPLFSVASILRAALVPVSNTDVLRKLELDNHLAAADPHPQYLTTAEGDSAYVNVTGDSMSGNLSLTNSADLRFVDTNGTYPTTAGGFVWTLNNDGASIKATQPSSDSINFVFKLNDNATANDRFIFWADDYQGAAFDKYPIVALGTGDVYLGSSSNGTDNPDLATYGLLVGQGTGISYHRGIFRVDTAPVNTTDVVRKLELDTKVAKAGDTMTGLLIFDGATGLRVGTTNKYEIYLGTHGPETYDRSIISTNVIRTLWSVSGDRWIYAPAPAGTADFTKEFDYNFTTSQWGFETPLKIGDAVANTDAITKGQVDTLLLGVGTDITNHLNDTTDAHDASAISYANAFIAPTSTWLDAINVQVAITQLGAQIEAPDASTIEAILAALNTIGTPTNPIDNSNIFQTGVILADAIAAGQILASKIAANVINASHIEANSFTGNEFNAQSVIRIGESGQIVIQGTDDPLTTSISARGTNPLRAYDEWVEIQKPSLVLPLDGNFTDRSKTTAYRAEGPAVWLPGTTGNYLTAPDSAALDITGDIEYVVRVDLKNWVTVAGIFGKGLAYRIIHGTSSNTLRLDFWTVPTGLVNITLGATEAFNINTPVWIKVTRVQSSGLVSLYWASDQPDEPIEWISLGTGTVAAGEPISSTTGLVEIGSRDSGVGLSEQTFHRAIVRNGISGITVLDLNAATDITDARATSFIATSGQTITVNRGADNDNAAITTLIPEGSFNWVDKADPATAAGGTDWVLGTRFAPMRIPNVPFPRLGLAERFLTAETNIMINSTTASASFVVSIPEDFNGTDICGLFSTPDGVTAGGGVILDGLKLVAIRTTASVVASRVEYTLPGPGIYAVGYRCTPGIGGEHTLFVNGNQVASVLHTVAPTSSSVTGRIGTYYGRFGANGSATLVDYQINGGVAHAIGTSGVTMAEFILEPVTNDNSWFADYYRTLFKGFATGDGFHIDASGRFSVGTSFTWDGRRYLDVGKGFHWDDETGTLRIGAGANENPLADFDGVWEARLGDTTGIPNTGTAGTALNATNSGLVRAEGPVTWLPGVAGNSLSVPDADNLDPAGDFEIVVRVKPNDWTPAARYTLIAKHSLPGISTASWALSLLAAGTLNFTWGNGTARSNTSSVATGAVDGTTLWLKMTLDINNGAGGSDVKFYRAPDSPTEPVSWTQLGTTSTLATTTAITPNTNPVHIGMLVDGATSPYKGETYRAIVRNGIGGTTVLDVNCDTDLPTGPGVTSFAATSGQTVTVNRSATGPVTTLVPKGKMVYINPAEETAGNRLSIPDTPEFDRTASDDLTLFFVGQVGNGRTAGAGSLFVLDTAITAGAVGFYYDGGNDSVVAFLGDDVPSYTTLSFFPTALQARTPLVYALQLDRATGWFTYTVYDASGPIHGPVTTTTALGGGTVTLGASALNNLAGSFSAAGWLPGVALGETAMAEVADYLLNQPTLAGGSVIESNNFYRAPGNVFSSLGTRIDLSTGAFLSPQLSINDSTGEAQFAGNLVAPSGDIGGWNIGATTITGGSTTLSSTGSVYQGVGNYDNTDTKWYLGSDGKFSLADQLTWDGVTLTVAGTIDGGVINIGGADTTSFHVDVDGNMWLGAATFALAPFKVSSSGALDVGGTDATSFHVDVNGNMWLGADTYVNAASKFRVSNTGVLNATDAVISGSITGGTIDIGGADTSSFHVDSTGNMWLGADTYVNAASKFRVSNLGVLNATSAVISGSITASSGSIGVISIVSNLTGGGAATGITVGTGAFGNANTALYIDSSGDFSLKDKFIWDQSAGTLSVNGSGTFSGTITASAGSIGAISIVSNLTGGGAATGMRIGTGAFNNANTAFYVDSAGYFSLKDQLSWNGTTLTIAGTAVINGNALVAGTVTASKLLITTGGSNQVSNSTFRYDLSGWSAYGVTLPVLTWMPTEGRRGEGCLRFVTSIAPTSDHGFGSSGGNYVSAGNGAARTASVWARNPGVNAVQFRIRGNTAGTSGLFTVPADNLWYRFTHTFTGDIGVFWRPVEIYNGTNVTGGFTLYVDDVQIEEGDIATAYSPKTDEILPGTVGTVSIASGAITADKVAVDALVSKTYTYTSGNFSDSGTYFNLSGVGYIRSKNFAIDASGNAFFKGDISGASGTFSGTVSGATITGGTITIGSGESIFKADTAGIYLGNATFGSAEFSVSAAGVLKATSGTIGGITLAATKMYVGTGTFDNANTAFYVDNAGNFSLKDQLTWDGNTLSIAGDITATTGLIGGWTINPANLASANNDIVLDPSGSITVGANYGQQITLDSATGTANATWDKIAAFDGLWLASEGDEAGIPNLGTTGSALDAVNTGLIRVEGPAVWYTGNASNNLSAAVGAISTPTGDLEQVFRWKTNWDQSPSSHVRPFHATSNDWSVSLFGGVLYVSYGTGGSVYTNNATAWLSGAAGVVDGIEVSARIRRASATGVVTMHYRISDDDAWTALSVTQPSPIAGVLHSWASQSLRMASDTTVMGGIIPIYDILRNGFDGPALFEFRRGNLAGVAHNATSFVATSGQTVTVARSTTGMATTIVPSGVVYINPNDAVATNRLTIPDNAAFDVGINDDGVTVFAGWVGNDAVSDFRSLFGTTNTPSSQITWQNSTNRIFGSWHDGVDQSAPNSVTSTPLNTPFVAIAVIDRNTDLSYIYVYTNSGLLGSGSGSSALIDALSPTTPPYVIMSIPAVVTATAWTSGVGVAISEPEAAEIAAYLLSNPVVPPASKSASIRIGGTGEFNQRADTIYLGDNQFSIGKDNFRYDGAALTIGDVLGGKYLSWDGVDLEVTQISAGTGTIGGFNINATNIVSTGNNLKLDSAIPRIEVGTGTSRVLMTGGLTPATSAIHSANITDFAVGGVGESGFWLDASGRLFVGAVVTGSGWDPYDWSLYNWASEPDHRFFFDGSMVQIIGDIIATGGRIGGWQLTYNTLHSLTNEIVLDAENKTITLGTVANNQVKLIGTSVATTSGVATGTTTGYGNGLGAWIGADGRMSLGGTDLTWDGNTLSISGDAVIQGNAVVNGTLSINKLEFPSPQGSNLVSNYSFADGTATNWALVEGGPAGHSVIVDATSPANNDDYVLSVGAASRAVGTKAIPLTPGKTYHISAWVKADSSAGIYYIRMNWKTAYPAGDYVTSGIRNGITPAMDEGVANSTITSWTKREFTWTAPAGAYWGSLSFYSWTGTTGLYVDEVTITEQAVTTSIANGAITTEKLFATAVQSTNYNATPAGWSNLFATAGMQINLSTGTLDSKNFVIEADGDVLIAGTVIAETGFIGNTTQGWSISGTTISSVDSHITLDSPNKRIQVGGAANRITLIGGGTAAGTTLAIGAATNLTTGIGLFADGDGKFRVGNPSANHMQWTGTALEISGAFIAKSKIKIGEGDTYVTIQGDDSPGNTAISMAANQDYSFALSSTQYLEVAAGSTPTITDPFSIRIHVALDDWKTASTQVLASSIDTGVNGGYEVAVTSAGFLQIQTSTGAASVLTTGTVDISTVFTNARAYWIRCDFLPNSLGNRVGYFYWAESQKDEPGPNDWILALGAPVSTSTTIADPTGANGFRVGRRASTASPQVAPGRYYRTILRKGTNQGALYFDNTTAATLEASSIPDNANLTPTDDYALRLKFRVSPPGTWVGSQTNITLAGQWTTTGNQRAWKITMDELTREIAYWVSLDGTAAKTHKVASVFYDQDNVITIDGSVQIAYTLVVGAGTYSFPAMHISYDDGKSWSQGPWIAATPVVSPAAYLLPFNSTSPLYLGDVDDAGGAEIGIGAADGIIYEFDLYTATPFVLYGQNNSFWTTNPYFWYLGNVESPPSPVLSIRESSFPTSVVASFTVNTGQTLTVGAGVVVNPRPETLIEIGRADRPTTDTATTFTATSAQTVTVVGVPDIYTGSYKSSTSALYSDGLGQFSIGNSLWYNETDGIEVKGKLTGTGFVLEREDGSPQIKLVSRAAPDALNPNFRTYDSLDFPTPVTNTGDSSLFWENEFSTQSLGPITRFGILGGAPKYISGQKPEGPSVEVQAADHDTKGYSKASLLSGQKPTSSGAAAITTYGFGSELSSGPWSASGQNRQGRISLGVTGYNASSQYMTGFITFNAGGTDSYAIAQKSSLQIEAGSVRVNYVEVNIVGEIRMWAGSKTGATLPQGWRFCDGSHMASTDYPALFAVIGNYWGYGDSFGYYDFNLPNATGGHIPQGITANANTRNSSVGMSNPNSDHSHGVSLNSGNVSADHSHYMSYNTGNVSAWHTHNYFSGPSGGKTTDNPSANHYHAATGNTGGISANHYHGTNGNTGNVSAWHSHNMSSLQIVYIINVGAPT